MLPLAPRLRRVLPTREVLISLPWWILGVLGWVVPGLESLWVRSWQDFAGQTLLELLTQCLLSSSESPGVLSQTPRVRLAGLARWFFLSSSHNVVY